MSTFGKEDLVLVEDLSVFGLFEERVSVVRMGNVDQGLCTFADSPTLHVRDTVFRNDHIHRFPQIENVREFLHRQADIGFILEVSAGKGKDNAPAFREFRAVYEINSFARSCGNISLSGVQGDTA